MDSGVESHALFSLEKVNMTGSLHITYAPHPDTTSESETEALAAVYAFVLKCREDKASQNTNSEDPEEGDDTR
jgi:hypothetical protein